MSRGLTPPGPTPGVPLRQRLGLVTTALVVAPVTAAAGVLMVLRGDLLLMVAGVLVLATGVLATAYLTQFLRTPTGTPRVRERDGATVLPESGLARVTAWGALAGSLVSLLVLVLAAVGAGADGAASEVGVWIAAGVLLLAVPTVAGVVHRRVRPGELVLTREAITLVSWNADRSLAWDDVVEVSMPSVPRRTLVVAAARAEDVGLGRRPVGVGEQQARSVAGADRALAISFPHLTGDPGTIARAVAHWCTTPPARGELGTPAARVRLSGRTEPTAAVR
ncbi:hypothetical protein [Marmoricola sp. Leaf446]|uniref:hypothetical protein n=1 Tax=Marmoricola sp. Leaf446 TaxID=1736379 RepID=UPI0012E3B307|nr:hypothetical protein [Marmoricola sp. Leaf446]